MSLFFYQRSDMCALPISFNKNCHIYLQGSKESDSGPGDDLNNLGPHTPTTGSMVSYVYASLYNRNC